MLATDEALGGLNIEVLDLDAEAGEQNLGLCDYRWPGDLRHQLRLTG